MRSGKGIYLIILIWFVLLFLTGCIYRPLITLDDLPFLSTSSETTIPEDEFDLSEARGRFFMPTQPRPMLPAPALELTWEVKQELRYFERSDRQFISQALQRRAKYYPAMAEVFRDEGVPLDLINLALIESGFQPKARSCAGAVGMWQFMKPTARAYGLKIGLFEDQRKDPILSSLAAARHLRDLYSRYQDWHLALAAYNAGTTLVDRSIRRAGQRNFWKIVRKGYLPRQTRRFVPRFIAATLLVKRHGLRR